MRDWHAGLLVLKAFLLSICLAAPVLAQSQRVLVMGAIHADPKSHFGTLQPLASYVAGALAPLGIETVEIVIVPDRNQMVNLLRDKRVDWVSETAFGAMDLNQRAGGELFLRKWSGGAAVYRSLFFARSDSGINDLAGLRDKIVAFEHRSSTSAFFVPASLMIADRLPLDALATPRERPRAGAFGYVFSGNEYNTAIWVKLGLVDAGVLSSADWVDEQILPAEFRDELVVFHESDDYPRAIEVIRADLDPRLKRKLRETLADMHRQPAAAEALAAYQNTARFDELTPENLSALAEIARLLGDFNEQFR